MLLSLMILEFVILLDRMVLNGFRRNSYSFTDVWAQNVPH